MQLRSHNPVRSASDDRAAAEELARAFREIDWLIPAWVSVGFLHMFAAAIDRATPDEKSGVAQTTLSYVYSAERLSAMHLDRYTKVMHVRDFGASIGESIESHFCGLDIAAVSTMVPVIEGIVRKMAVRQHREVGQGTRKLIGEFDALVERERNSPHRYEERLVMLEVLRDFMREKFLKNTDKYAGLNELNRHGIVHGIYEKFGEEINFYRLITLLDLLCFSIGLMEGGSCFAASSTPESQQLAARYLKLQLATKVAA